ncbi:MAG TPA: GNAT family N-acetyltransferase [Hyphomicrobiaceae bacterium]
MRTKRLLLRDLTLRDVRRIAMLASDWDVARMTGRIPHPYSEELARQWISDLTEGEFVQGIVSQGELVGLCGYMPDGNSAEIGYWVGKPWWGRGFATEAAGALIDYCFNEVGFERITCGHFVDNPASARVIAKLGFRFTGWERVWCEARQSDVDTLKYERLRQAGEAKVRVS